MMTKFNPDSVTADELYEYCLAEYKSNNPIVKRMLSNYYAKIRGIINFLDKHDRLLEVGCGTGTDVVFAVKNYKRQS